MRQRYWGIRPKLILAFAFVAFLSLLFSFLSTKILYEQVYIGHVEETLENQGKMLMVKYHESSDLSTFKQEVILADLLSEATVIYSDNPRELGACLPFEEENDESLVNLDERYRLLEGEIIRSKGYNSRLEREILAVSIPLMKDEMLGGILFLYIPLATISETFSNLLYFWIAFGLLFLLFAALLSGWLTQRITKPIREMESVAEQMAKGSYGERILIDAKDEIGRLGAAINTLSTSLSEVEQKRREFIANLSHELRTPINYISGYSDAMLEGLAESEEQREEYLQIIVKESERMKRLVHDLLDLAQLEGEAYPLKKNLYPFAQQIEDVLISYRPKMREQGITLVTELDPEIIIHADHDRITQVISNLVDNARKYTPAAGTVTIRLTTDQEWIILEISDTGIGIPEEDLEHIGERFYRVDKSRSRQQGGTGLGIAIVKQIIKNHGGKLEVRSRLGKGTDVIIYLPKWDEDNAMNDGGLS